MDERFQFEAWDKQRKIMWKMQPTEEGYFFTDGSANALECHDCYYEFGEILMMQDRFVLRQCTGFKDKNLKVIFEGDIVKFLNIFTKEFLHAVVEWDKEYARFNINGSAYWNHIRYLKFERLEDEVVGNIYQNSL